MKSILKLISFVGLVLTVVPSILVLQGSLGQEASKNLMLIGTLCWFLSAPFWLGRKSLKKNTTS